MTKKVKARWIFGLLYFFIVIYISSMLFKAIAIEKILSDLTTLNIVFLVSGLFIVIILIVFMFLIFLKKIRF